MNHAVFLISCPDQKGITATVTNFIFQHNGNIIHADQHIDEQTNTFFMRLEWSLKGFNILRNKIEGQFSSIADKFKMHWSLSFADEIPKVAIFVSKHVHCLQDILIRHRSGQLRCHIACIISNHASAKAIAREFDIHFFEFPMTPQTKMEQEKRQIQLLHEAKVEVVVLARYHQILTEQFIAQFPSRIINIHHSFLPAFVGKNPYHQAQQKGVKIIGATSHYVVEELDHGPIIEQDTVRISHRDSLEDILRKGEDLEKIVLSRAIRWHLEKKVLCYNNKTVIFD